MVRAGFAVALLFGRLALSQDMSITVRTFNQCKVRCEVLRKGEAEAAYLLGTAAVHVLWVDCSNSGECNHEIAPNEVAVLVRHSPRPPKHATNREVLGKALIAPKVRSTYAIVYYDAVQAAAKRQGVITEPDLVGYVMAHEIGHLLGANHNVNTIMKGSVVSRDMDALYKREPRFSRQERDGIRSEVLARLRSVSRDLPVASEQ